MEISFSDLIFSIINFLILVGLLAKFAYKPLMKMMDNRERAINESLDRAAEAQKAADEYTFSTFILFTS